jgi:hypothetical protein
MRPAAAHRRGQGQRYGSRDAPGPGVGAGAGRHDLNRDARAFGPVGHVDQLLEHDRWRPHEPAERGLVQHRDEMRWLGAVEYRLAFQPQRDQLVSLDVVGARRDEQRPGVLRGLQQSRDDQRLPDAQRVGLALGPQPVLKPGRHRAARPPGQHGQPREQLIVELARLAPRGQYLIGRRPLAGLRLGHHRPVKAKPCRQRFLAAEACGHPRPPQLETKERRWVGLRITPGHRGRAPENSWRIVAGSLATQLNDAPAGEIEQQD